MWDQLAPDLVRQDVVTHIDTQALGGSARQMARYRQCQRLIEQQGMMVPSSRLRGAMMPNPMISTANRCMEIALKLSVRLAVAA